MSRAVVAELLRQRVKALGLDQRDLALTVGVDPATVSRWLRGGALPNPNVVPLLAKTLEIQTDELWKAINSAQREELRDQRKRHDAALARVLQAVEERNKIDAEMAEDLAAVAEYIRIIAEHVSGISGERGSRDTE